MSDSPVQPTRPVRVQRIGLAQRLMLLGMLAVLLITGVGGLLMRDQLHAAILRSMTLACLTLTRLPVVSSTCRLVPVSCRMVPVLN